MEPRERYQRDPHFFALVNMLRAQIERAQLTPTEIREAAMLAQIMYEETNVRRMWIFPPGSGEGPGAYANEYGSLAQDLAGTPRTEKTP